MEVCSSSRKHMCGGFRDQETTRAFGGTWAEGGAARD